MPSTYSSNLKIELMSTGENSGTWGNITNTNLGTALEQAVVGYGAVSYASDANLTISITNSNAAQAARALVLNVTSAVSLTGTRELVVPTIEKQYIVQNNTTGSQSITVKTSAGTGITVPNGRKAHLYVDGTNVIQMFDFVDINGGTIDGTPIGGSSAAAGAFTTLNASGATTLDGNVALGNASGDLITFPGTINSHLLFTDNTYDIGANGATRPRNLFLAGAATIGGNLSVGGTLTLTGGLILNGNVTVGDNASDTLTINSTITSNLLFTDNTYDIGASGATRPRNLFLAGNATIGGNQTLTGSLTVDSTTDSSSTTTGSIQTDGGLGVAKALYVGTTANIAGAVTLSGGTANGVAYLNGSKVLTTGSALTFDGTTFATTGRTSSANGAWVASGAVMGWGAAGTFTNYIVGDTASNYLLFQVNSAEGMRLTSTGLGIGTSSPAYRLDVAGSTTTARLGKLTITNDTPFYTGANLDAGSQSFGIGTSGAGIVGFLTNNNERVRITTDGYVGIRTSSPAGFLHVAPGNAASSGAGAPIILQAQQGATSNAGGNVLIGSGQNGPGSSNGYIAFGIGSATSGSAFSAGETMRITDTGNFGFNLTTPTAVLSGSNTLLDAGNANGAEYIARRTGGGAVLATGVTSSNTGYLWMSTNTNLLFGTNNTERARITSGGDLLVGTGTAILSSANRGNITIGGSASSILALGSAQANALYIYTENTNADVWNTANGFLRFGTNNTERVRITNAGYFLVGTTQNTNNYQMVVLNDLAIYTATDASGSTNLRLGSSLSMPQGIAVLNGTKTAVGGGDMLFSTASGGVLSEKMRLTGAGNVGINTTSPSFLLDVNGSMRVTGSKKVFYFDGMPPNYPNDTTERAVVCDTTFTPSSATDVQINQTQQGLGHWVVTVQMSGDRNGTGVGLATMVLEFDTYSNSGGTYVILNPKLRRNYSQNGTFYALTTAPNIAITKSGTANIILTIAGTSQYLTGLCRVEFYGSSYTSANQITLSLPGTSTSSSWLPVNGWDQTNTTGTTPTNVNVLYTNGSESVRVTSDGLVGIGTSSPFGSATNKTLTVAGQTRGQLALQGSFAGATDICQIQAFNGANTMVGRIRWINATGTASDTGSMWTMATTAGVESTATITNAYGIGLGESNPPSSGLGIAFPATQSASSNANTLDDYEEGTWTPTITYATPGTLAVTYNTQSGTYTKVGNLVTLSFGIRLASFSKGTASGELRVGGVPFAQAFDTAIGTVGLYDSPFSSQPILVPGTTFFNLLRLVNNAGWASLDDPDANSQYFGSITIRV